MKVSYITMRFPAPSETFACNDVRVLERLGVRVKVFSLLPKLPGHLDMVKSRGIKSSSIYNSGYKENLKGVVSALENPILSSRLFLWIFFKSLKSPLEMAKCFSLFPASMYIWSCLKKNPPDVVHLFWGHYPCLVGYLVEKGLPNTKLSIFLGAYDLEASLKISDETARFSDFVFTHAHANKPAFRKIGVPSKKLHVVHRGVDLGSLYSIVKQCEKDKNSWLAAGRLIPEKGFDKVVVFFVEYLKVNYDAKLNIVGDGPERFRLEELVDSLGVQESVVFHGHVEQKELISMMGIAHVFLLFSNKKGERLPNVLKEAMLARCICITYYSLGIDELILDGQDGFIIRENDRNTRDVVFEWIINDNGSIGHEARKKILENFSSERLMKQYLNAWRKL